MKKSTSFILSIFITALFFSSCKKDGTTVTKVVNVEVNMNGNYSYNIPKSGGDKMAITNQADHSLKSIISNSSNSTVLFEYTPALDYSGSDEVLISNSGDTGGKHGGCPMSNHEKDVTIYDFKINVKSSR